MVKLVLLLIFGRIFCQRRDKGSFTIQCADLIPYPRCTETMFCDKNHLAQFLPTAMDFREILGERMGGTHFGAGREIV
jgi:hypothetical protein